MRCFELPAQFPVLVHTVQPVREPAGADFKKCQAQLGEAHRNSLENYAGEMQEDADRERVAVHLGERSKRAGANLGRRAAVAVDGERHVKALRLFIERVVLLSKVIVGGAASGDTKLGLAQLRDVAGAGRKQHRLFNIVFAHDFKPQFNLLRRAQIALVAGVTKSVEEIRVKGLIGRPQARVAAVPWWLEVFADVALAFQHMSIGVYYWRPVSHDFSSFNCCLSLRAASYHHAGMCQPFLRCYKLSLARSVLAEVDDCG